MKLLVITQKIDIQDDVLGFFHRWLEKLAEGADLSVITNYVGQHQLPKNVKVYSLGKEKSRGRFSRFLLYQWLILKILLKTKNIFYHMCPEYVLAAGLWPNIFGAKTLLWYTHKKVDLKLKIAEKLVDKIFTASAESCRLSPSKVEVVGHGIDMEKFSERPMLKNNIFRIISVGRIAPVKNYELMIEVAEILNQWNFNFEMRIAGAPILERDKIYFEKIQKSVKEKQMAEKIVFVGPIPHQSIVSFYQIGSLLINLSDTGSLDKVVLEAMAAGLPVLTSNEAFKNILSDKYFTRKDSKEIVEKIIYLKQNQMDESLRDYVAVNHNLAILINKIINFFQ